MPIAAACVERAKSQGTLTKHSVRVPGMVPDLDSEGSVLLVPPRLLAMTTAVLAIVVGLVVAQRGSAERSPSTDPAPWAIERR